jgi:hypothetical protein
VTVVAATSPFATPITVTAPVAAAVPAAIAAPPWELAAADEVRV